MFHLCLPTGVNGHMYQGKHQTIEDSNSSALLNGNTPELGGNNNKENHAFVK
jgi:hypothetical protein